MVEIYGNTIRIPRGDTGAIRFRVTGAEMTDEHRGVFTLAARGNMPLLRKVIAPGDNRFEMMFVHEDTASLRAGEYGWSFRVVRGAAFDEKGRYTDPPENQDTPIREGRLLVLEVKGGVR